MKNWLAGFVLTFELSGTQLFQHLAKPLEGYIRLCHDKKKMKISKWNISQEFLG